VIERKGTAMTGRGRRARFTATLFAGALALSASGTALAGVDATIRGSGTSWNPTRVTIGTGDTVRWKAVGSTHTVTSYGGGWSKDTRITAGEATRRTFNSTGTFKFYCRIHGNVSGGTCTGMCGRVVVR
jgi:plastocyanin